MTTPLTLGRAIAWAAIFDADPDRLPHWSVWSADLRAWAGTQSETPCQDTNIDAEQGTMGGNGDRSASGSALTLTEGLIDPPQPTEPGGSRPL